MEEEIEVVAFACRGTLLDWTGAIEAVAYELARCNGESPLDRGAALRRRVETLADGHGLARGFERLARERGYRGEESGEESLARVIAHGAPPRVARAKPSRSRSGPGSGWSPFPGPRTPARCTCSAARSRPSWPTRASSATPPERDPVRERRPVAARRGAAPRHARGRARRARARRSAPRRRWRCRAPLPTILAA